MLGADVGTALMARVLTFDLSSLSPLLIPDRRLPVPQPQTDGSARIGRVLIGLGLIVLALS